MLAALPRAPGPIEENPLVIADIPEPPIREAEVRIRVCSCGLCHTDFHTVEGELALPVIPGPEEHARELGAARA